MRKRDASVAVCFGVLAALLTALPSPAVVDSQIDTFESGTTAGWQAGLPHPAPPQNVASGGPAGAGDHYLALASVGGFGPGSRLGAFNPAQWGGGSDYTAAGVGAIIMDVNNLGSIDLALRLFFADGQGQGFSNAAVSTDAKLVPAGSGWVKVAFRITPADLTAVSGTAAAALSDTTALWLIHNDVPGFPPPPLVASVGVDNIEALPEPGAAAAFASGCALLALLERRRARRS